MGLNYIWFNLGGDSNKDKTRSHVDRQLHAQLLIIHAPTAHQGGTQWHSAPAASAARVHSVTVSQRRQP